MKTNTSLTVLLIVTLALAGGCAGRGNWKSKMAGTYKGFIHNGDEKHPSITTIKLDGDKLSGKYELEVLGSKIDGELREFVLTGDREVRCGWIDYSQRTGDLEMTFSPDFSSFKGTWYDEGMTDGDPWTGKK
ncbi:MAG: hypothetical protein QGH60_24025 [Phycisphaerae bacterium]|jgi:hypothetical protein|nr:hypothetical protein [Phycisphaerae bacterium]